MVQNIYPPLALILHVKTQKDREQNVALIKEELGFPCELMLDGDISDLNDEIIDKYFYDLGNDKLHSYSAVTSCAYKHFLCCKYIIDHNLPGALILEDDIFLYDNFHDIFSQSLKEYQKRYADNPVLINYEDSALLFVPRSERRKGQILYEKKEHRFAGCYYINRKGAEVIWNYVSENKTHYPSDWTHMEIAKKGLLKYLWSHPTIATQGSANGLIPSSISTRKRGKLRLKWFFKLYYKKLLYFIR